MKKNRTFKCKYCNRKFDSEQALASHLRVHKKKKERVKVKREDDDPPEDDPNPTPQPVQPQPIQQPQPIPPPQQYQYAPPQPQDYPYQYQQQYYQPQQVQAQQPAEQSDKKYNPIEILFTLLSTPAIAEAIKTLLNRQSSSGGEDPIKEMAVKQMLDAWKFEYELGKRYSETPIETMKILLEGIKGKKRVILLPMPIQREDNEKEKLMLVELAKKLDKLEKLLDELNKEEEDGEFVNVGEGELL